MSEKSAKRYAPPANDQTYYITKYALTGGIVKVKGHLCENRQADALGGDLISVAWVGVQFGTGTAHFHKGEWHTTLEAAQDRVQVMKADKLKALRRQVAKLEATCVSSMPVDDRTALAAAED